MDGGFFSPVTAGCICLLPIYLCLEWNFRFFFFVCVCVCVCIESGTTIIELPIHWIHSTKRIAGKTLSMMMLLLLLLEIGARVTRDVKQQMFFFCYTNTIYLCVSFFFFSFWSFWYGGWWRWRGLFISRTLFLSEWIMSYYVFIFQIRIRKKKNFSLCCFSNELFHFFGFFWLK